MKTAARWLSLLLCLVLLTGMTAPAGAEGTGETAAGTEGILTGLVEKDGAWYLYSDQGIMMHGWQTVGEDRYYFNYDGRAATGMIYLSNGYYFFGSDGKMQTGWVSDGTSRYYCGEDGRMAQGLTEIDGATYYLIPAAVTGMQYVNDPKTQKSGTCFFGSDGKMQTGWVSDGTSRYYCREDGTVVQGLVKIDGDTYYLTPAMATGSWSIYDPETQKSGYYYFGSDGKMQTGWVTAEEQDYEGKAVSNKYYYGSDGLRVTGWQTIGGEKYYLNPAAWTGLKSIRDEADGEYYRYYFDGEGRMQTGLVFIEDDGTYYFGSDGKAVSGWIETDSAAYHFSTYSYRADTGLHWIDKVYYLFNEKGEMQTGWADAGESWGWRLFGSNGAMVESFEGWSSVTIPAEVTSLTNRAFRGIGRDFVVYCTPGSYAEAFAKQNGLQYDNGQTRVVGYNITNLNDKAKWVVANYTDGSMSSLEKVRALHDWLIHNAHYDTSYSSYSASGVMLNGSGVCQSYAEAIELLMRTAGIECILQSGTADNGTGSGKVGHAWNMIKLGDHWYHLDATWDDPTNLEKDDPIVSGHESYSYFLISDEEIGKDHFWYSNHKAPVSIAYEGDPGWQNVAGEWVYYGANGYLTTGPTEIDGVLYGLGEDGRLMSPGWHTVKGQYCYAGDGGILVTEDWIGGGGDWYYLDENGFMQTGWAEIDGKWYCLGDDGKMQTGWVQSGGTWYYLNASGAMATGWANDGSDWYYFNEDGRIQTGWIEDNGAWYCLGSNGVMQTGWIQSGGTWYYLNASGAMATGWALDGGKWYFFGDSGAMVTGWAEDNGAWYFLGPDGAMQTGWIRDGAARYLLGSDGKLATGWVQDGGKWYWFSSSGTMATGWAEIDGRWEMFDNSGVWQYTWNGQ